ncbi:MAG TPA: hypothetical protein VF599_19205 [Pyrinomonadaceae bacterium]|jgi:hypothetical protein
MSKNCINPALSVEQLKPSAGIEQPKREQMTTEISDYFGKVFDTDV